MALVSGKQLSLREVLDNSTIEGTLCELLQGYKIRCYACAHQRVIFPGKRGAFRMRRFTGYSLACDKVSQGLHMTDPDDTSAETRVRAAEIGPEVGLRFVYSGNRAGDVGPWENTYCPGCRTLLVERFAYVILGCCFADHGHC